MKLLLEDARLSFLWSFSLDRTKIYKKVPISTKQLDHPQARKMSLLYCTDASPSFYNQR